MTRATAKVHAVADAHAPEEVDKLLRREWPPSGGGFGTRKSSLSESGDAHSFLVRRQRGLKRTYPRPETGGSLSR